MADDSSKPGPPPAAQASGRDSSFPEPLLRRAATVNFGSVVQGIFGVAVNKKLYTRLQEAQNIRAVAQAPWLLFTPAAAIVIAVLSLNFLGDGLRDAADPYDSV